MNTTDTMDTKEKPTCFTLVSLVSFVLTERATNNREPAPHAVAKNATALGFVLQRGGATGNSPPTGTIYLTEARISWAKPLPLRVLWH